MIGAHNGGVKEIFYIDEIKALVSMSYDKTIKFWNLGNPNPVSTLNLDQKVYSADIAYPIMILGLSSEKVVFYDLMSLNTNVPL